MAGPVTYLVDCFLDGRWTTVFRTNDQAQVEQFTSELGDTKFRVTENHRVAGKPLRRIKGRKARNVIKKGN